MTVSLDTIVSELLVIAVIILYDCNKLLCRLKSNILIYMDPHYIKITYFYTKNSKSILRSRLSMINFLLHHYHLCLNHNDDSWFLVYEVDGYLWKMFLGAFAHSLFTALGRMRQSCWSRPPMFPLARSRDSLLMRTFHLSENTSATKHGTVQRLHARGSLSDVAINSFTFLKGIIH